MPKNLKGALWVFFNIHFVAKHQKIEGTLRVNIFFQKMLKKVKKSTKQCQKKLRGGSFSLSQYFMLRGNRGKTFLVQFARSNDSICGPKTSYNFLGLFWSVDVDCKKNLKMSHYNSRVQHHEAPTKYRAMISDLLNDHILYY